MSESNHPGDEPTKPALSSHIAPLICCLAAGLVLALAQIVVWRWRVGEFVCIDTLDIRYGLQIAARSYYGHPWYLTDPAVAGGVTYYSWLQYGLAAVVARTLGLSPFSIEIMWKLWVGVGLSAGLYAVFWLLLRARWVAVGCTLFWLSDSGTCCYFSHPVVDHLRRVASALFKHRDSLLNLAPEPLWQLGVPHPGVILPFALLQIAAMVYARGCDGIRVKLLAGLTFAITFYLYFYLWTAIAVGLALAFAIDREERRLYMTTLVVGVAAGVPQLALDRSKSALVSQQALHRFGLMVPATSAYLPGVPYAGLSILLFCAFLIWYRKNWKLIYPWSLAAGAMVLSRSSAISGIAIHEYHWDWFWQPTLALVLTVVVVDELRIRWRRQSILAYAFAALVALYFVGGLYLTVEAATRTPLSSKMVASFARYRAQRMTLTAPPLRPGSMIAGDEDFCDLSVIAEDQRALGGFALSRSLSLDDAGWRSRMALNAYLLGMTPTEFRQRILDEEYWGPLPDISPATMAAFEREYAEVSRNPANVLDTYHVRYLVLPMGRLPPSSVRSRWTLYQSGPYWDLWRDTR
jgi:hypothetical protein